MKTTKTKTPQFRDSDHLLLMFLTAMHDFDYEPQRMGKYVSAARTILHSPNAFDGGSGTLAIENFVVKREELRHPDADRPEHKEFNRALDRILEGNEGEQVTMDAYALLMLLHSVCNDAALYGAAIGWELAKGGAR